MTFGKEIERLMRGLDDFLVALEKILKSGLPKVHNTQITKIKETWEAWKSARSILCMNYI